jgi:glycosyltransferase involved in cell wall biosynthesis
MSRRAAAFAIPGDIATLTGGYIYERRLLGGLREIGHDVRHIELGASFPDPTSADMADAVARLAALEPERALILDGLVYGSIDPAGLARVRSPIVAMIHHPLALESGLAAESREHLYRTERENLALARHVLVPSPHTASILTADYDVPRERITIARPGTDRPKHAQPRRSEPAGPPLILSVGILHPRKGHDVLLKALSRIVDRDWRAVIVGYAHDPAHADELETLRQSLDLVGRVRFAGRVASPDLDDLYRGASVFALATRYEGYGIVFDEALAHGLPIVTCRTGAVPDTVPRDAGVLVPTDDPDALAVALAALLDDDGRRRSLADASAEAGRALPGWLETARTAGRVLDRL